MIVGRRVERKLCGVHNQGKAQDMLSLTMLTGKTVIVKHIDKNDCTEHYQIVKRIEKSKMKGLSISCNIVIEICSTLKY